MLSQSINRICASANFICSIIMIEHIYYDPFAFFSRKGSVRIGEARNTEVKTERVCKSIVRPNKKVVIRLDITTLLG